MKLTKTQKNFRKQMENTKQEPDIYDTTRKGNPFHNVETSTIAQIVGAGLIVFLLFFLPFKLFQYIKHPDTSPKNPSPSPSNIQQTPPLNNGILTNKAVIPSDAVALQQLAQLSAKKSRIS